MSCMAKLALLVLAVAEANDDAVVTLPFGKVHGLLFSDHREFLGIPYATAKRFAAPGSWTEPYPESGLNATAFTPMCWQAGCTAENCSESCLRLNIFAPRHHKPRVPTMLWIHGGALESGSAMNRGYNGSNLAANHGVVVVAINYRLNVFGFSAVPQADGSTLANHGYRDQREAMRWVRAYIGAFGGDGGRVTIFGESAGGQSVLAHVVSPGSAGLFDGAISESGDATLVQSSLPNKERSFKNLGLALGCDKEDELVACLEAVDATKLVNAYAGLSPTPTPAVVDGDIYPASPEQLTRQGRFNSVPLIMGGNNDEGNLFIFTAGSGAASAHDVACVFNKTFGASKAAEILDMYPPTDAKSIDNRNRIAEVLSDLFYHCVDRELARGFTKHGAAPWIYKFKRPPKCGSAMGTPGAYHSSEIPFVFDKVDEAATMSGCTATRDEIALGHRMAGLWASFATNLEADASWRRFSLEDEPSLSIDLGTVQHMDNEEGYRRAQCDLIDSIIPEDGEVRTQVFYDLMDGLAICQASPEFVV